MSFVVKGEKRRVLGQTQRHRVCIKPPVIGNGRELLHKEGAKGDKNQPVGQRLIRSPAGTGA